MQNKQRIFIIGICTICLIFLLLITTSNQKPAENNTPIEIETESIDLDPEPEKQPKQEPKKPQKNNNKYFHTRALV